MSQTRFRSIYYPMRQPLRHSEPPNVQGESKAQGQIIPRKVLEIDTSLFIHNAVALKSHLTNNSINDILKTQKLPSFHGYTILGRQGRGEIQNQFLK